jgi:hypothetical protein
MMSAKRSEIWKETADDTQLKREMVGKSMSIPIADTDTTPDILRKKTWKGFSAVSNCKKLALFPIPWLFWTLFSQDLLKTAELNSVGSANLSGP